MIEDVLKTASDKSEIIKDIVQFAGDLNIARRNWSAYPQGHPVIVNSLQKLDSVIHSMLEKKPVVSLGITRDSILIGEEFVEKGNPVCRSVAFALFERGIGTLIIKNPPSIEEFASILTLFTFKREDILGRGGIVALWQEAGVTSIDVIGIRYDRFSGTEESSINDTDLPEFEGNLWEQLVRAMSIGESDLDLVGLGSFKGEMSPELLAETLNSRYISNKTRVSGKLSSTVSKNTLKVMREILSREHEQLDDITGNSRRMETTYQDGLLSFFKALDPTLRRKILDGFCEVSSDSSSDVEDIMSTIGPALLQETYATAQEYASAPTLLKGILRKLLPHSSDFFETVTPFEEAKQKIKSLLVEHEQEAYIPEEYFNDLQDVMSDMAFKPLAKQDLQTFMKTLQPSAIETRSSEIILQLVITDPGGGNSEQLIKNLTEMCVSFLELGDYDQVLKILNQAADPAFPTETRMAMRKAFSSPEFLEEIISGLTIWGKSRYDQVIMLIRIIGRPFIEPLLNRLTEEDNMSLRRFLMDRILYFGDAAIPGLVARLSDNRWYVLRNIIVMLRTIAPGRETEPLKPLLRHSNIKVRHEALKSLLIAGDQMAERMVMRDLDSTDHETQLSAIHLSDKNSTDATVKKLLNILSSGGYSQMEYEVKSAIVLALAETGRPGVLPELIKILGSRSLLAYKSLNRLKIDIVRSLDRYPPTDVQPILQKLAKGSDDIARQAMETLKNLRGRNL